MAAQYLKPFRGIIYNEEKAGGIDACVCPPYDVISDDEVYLEKSPFNAIRLELPRPFSGLDRYMAARKTFDEWYDRGIIGHDGSDTIYIYEQEFQIDGRSHLRRGFIALQKLDRDRILTHEQTRKKAKEDREKLIASLGAYTSFPFGLYEDGTLEIEGLLAGAERERLFEFTDEQGVKNRFYRMTRPAEMDQLCALMDIRKVYIADGHHRLDVSYRLNLSQIPFYLTNMYSPGIVIFPYHRMVTFEEKRPLSSVLTLLDGKVGIEKIPFTDPDSPREVVRRISSSAEPAFALYSGQDPANIYFLTARAPAETSGPLERLKVNILHSGILRQILGIREEEISFTQDTEELIQCVRAGKADLAFLLPPTTSTEVKEVADEHLDMPPKSTFFYPKILTGLVFYKYA